MANLNIVYGDPMWKLENIYLEVVRGEFLGPFEPESYKTLWD